MSKIIPFSIKSSGCITIIKNICIPTSRNTWEYHMTLWGRRIVDADVAPPLRTHARTPRPAHYWCGHPAHRQRLLHFEVRPSWSQSRRSPDWRHALEHFPWTLGFYRLFCDGHFSRRHKGHCDILWTFLGGLNLEQDPRRTWGCFKPRSAPGPSGFSVLRDI